MQINEFVKRARAAKIHAYIISHLKKQMPAMMGKAKVQQKLIDNLEGEFAKVWIQIVCILSAHMHAAIILIIDKDWKLKHMYVYGLVWMRKIRF